MIKILKYILQYEALMLAVVGFLFHIPTSAPPHDFKWLRLRLRQRCRKILSGFRGEFRSCAVDDDINSVGVLRKGGVELPLALPPIKIGRDELTRIRRNGKIGADICDRARGQDEPQYDRQPREFQGAADDLRNRVFDHPVTGTRHFRCRNVQILNEHPAPDSW